MSFDLPRGSSLPMSPTLPTGNRALNPACRWHPYVNSTHRPQATSWLTFNYGNNAPIFYDIFFICFRVTWFFW